MKKEKDAKETYLSITSSQHTNFKISEAGLFVDINNPYLGATPDCIVYCDCCGGGVLEVKCPYCYIEDIPEANETWFCITKDDDAWSLKCNHAYYYQVQLQLHVCNMSYVDFVVWSQETTVIERIFPDKDFSKLRFKQLGISSNMAYYQRS